MDISKVNIIRNKCYETEEAKNAKGNKFGRCLYAQFPEMYFQGKTLGQNFCS